MEHEIKSINPKAAAKAVGATFLFGGAFLGLLLSLLAWLGLESVNLPELPGLLAQLLIATVAGYVLTRLFCVVYNRVADRWGGIRFDLAEIHSPLNPKWKP